LTQPHFDTSAAAKVGDIIAQAMTLYFNLQADVAFADSSGLVQIDNAWIMPIGAGLAYGF
jgi:hypothetical protein